MENSDFTQKVKSTSIFELRELTLKSNGQYVRLFGWIHQTRAQGAGDLLFVDLNDGTLVTPVRCVAHRIGSTTSEDEIGIEYGSVHIEDTDLDGFDSEEYTKLDFDQACQSSFLSKGCAVMMYGLVTKAEEGRTQKFEVKIIDIYVIGRVPDPEKYPIQRSNSKKPELLRNSPHDRFKAPLILQYMKIRSETLFAFYEFMHKHNIPQLDPNIMTKNDCEGAGETFGITPQFFGAKAMAVLRGELPSDTDIGAKVGLTVSSQLPLEAISKGTRKVYTCQKSFRAEHSVTKKHLAEFLHAEYEEYFITLSKLMDFTETMIKYLIKTVLDRCSEQYNFLEDKRFSPEYHHTHRKLLQSLLTKQFVRIKHADAIEEMQQDLKAKVKVPNAKGKMVRLKFAEYPRQGQDLASEHEKYLTYKYGTFVFVTHWPLAIKSFYMKQVDDGTCESFDLLAPIVGELFGGSMREWRYDLLLAEMQKREMNIETLQWFVDIRKEGSAPHGGWGMGFDRLVLFLTNAPSIRDIVPYPVYYGHCPY